MSHPLLPVLDRLAEARVVCIGDLMLDEFIYGSVGRISPEAPVPVLKVASRRQMLGGVGNVASNLAALGVSAHLAACCGRDEAATEMRILLDALSGCTHHLEVCPERPTTRKSRCIGLRQQMLRIDQESISPLDEVASKRLLTCVQAWLVPGCVLVLSDYGKGVLSDALIADLVAAAHAQRVMVIADPSGSDYRRYCGVDLVTPNVHELRQACGGAALSSDDELIDAARTLAQRCGIQHVLVTRGGAGMTLVGADTFIHLPARARAVFDVSGAGDTVVAVLAAALASGASLEVGARLANLAAGIVVAKPGTATVAPEELATELGRSGELLERQAAAARCAAWRRQGLRVGFTNGCFDIIHAGHLHLLAESAARCDRLVVGLNTDRSVRALKGPTRPIHSQAQRAQMLSALRWVDLVVPFDEDTPQALIEALCPQLLVKGDDYTLAQIIGAEQVLAQGGEVHRVSRLPDLSSTAIIERLSGAGNS